MVFAVLAVIAAVSVLLSPPTGQAHPFGPPLTARISVDGDDVMIHWSAAEDDWVILGNHVGAFDAPGDPAQPLTGAEMLGRSTELQAYLLDNIGVRQDGQTCAGRVDAIGGDPVNDGARLVYECHRAAREVDLTVTMLTDVNENYRTVVTADTPASPGQEMFTSGADTRTWTFEATAASGPPAIAVVVIAVAVAGVVAAASTGVVVAVRRRRLAGQAPRPASSGDRSAASDRSGGR